MRMDFVRPKEEAKPFRFELEEVCTKEDDTWNSFSVTPKVGEKYGHYSFAEVTKSDNKCVTSSGLTRV